MQTSATEQEGMLTSNQVCQTVGITYRQLDYWVRTGAVDSPGNSHLGSGQRRVWSPEEVERLKVVVEQIRDAQMILDAFSSGNLWRAVMA